MKLDYSLTLKIMLVAALAVLAILYWPTNEKRIIRRYEGFIREASKTGKESLASQGLKKVRLGEVLGSNLVLRLGYPFPETMDRDEFMRMLQYVRYQTTLLDIKNRGAKVYPVDAGMYEMETTVEADVHVGGQADRFLGSYRLIWEKQNASWVITSGEQLNVIEHPQWR